MKSLFTLFTLLIVFNPPLNIQTHNFHFLIGTWKVENKENYEKWSIKNNDLEGNSYKIRNGNTQIEEYLTIKIINDKVIYTAKVVNQNAGQPIEFVLNKSIKDKLSFENSAHDFPKKIQYTKRNDTTLFVSVLGKDDKGFSYNLIKQK